MKEYRGYTVDSAPLSPSLVRVFVTGQGGKIPDFLTGLFTSHNAARAAIDVYLDTMKVKRNGKADPESGD